jgi:hypothetical protein
MEVRFLSPTRLRDIRSSGAASDVAWQEEEAATVIRLRATGPCAITAVAAEPQ